ncbi:CpaF family protein [Denitrobaculum tricleocarpae]|uniref:CpaF family protein n=1 Tax=Denitrobaculum tricleocarpae TaxID=2591009 RepID=A0A545TPA2_9PROT|nr:CpaF family protein [Denitrobaculum tricleocarpae]TQV79043.1 CpaF family protein [Denitrobaculum tricleocarpae]
MSIFAQRKNAKPGKASAQAQSNLAPYIEQLKPKVAECLSGLEISQLSRPELGLRLGQLVTSEFEKQPNNLNLLERRTLLTELINWVTAQYPKQSAPTQQQSTQVASSAERASVPDLPPAPSSQANAAAVPDQPDPFKIDERRLETKAPITDTVEAAKDAIHAKVMERLDVSAASQLPREELSSQLGEIVSEVLAEEKIRLNGPEQAGVVELMLADMLGLGPLEPLLADEKVTDIMVNGPYQVYVERGGKLELSDIKFRDNDHVVNISRRIVAQIGRRVDETTPLVDARLLDGSRVNIVIPPLAIDGASISIRKFAKKGITLDVMARQGNINEKMAMVLKIAARSRLNILISGGTGSGKTTLLNALSQMIDPGERIVTIEDAAELQLQQPHVVRLETRPANLEGEGAIDMRDLVKNTLRMRPDRIILGEVRGGEAVDMLQAMNTGHDGSLGTIHANRPREGLTRLENMIGLAGINLPAKAVRTQISDAVHMIVQISRMRDGMRRVTHITEIVGMEGEIITTQDLYTFEFEGEDADGNLVGSFKSSGLRPFFAKKAAYFGLEQRLLEAM